MIPPEEALRLILEEVAVLPEETAETASCVGRILCRDITAREDLPSFDQSAMDGFAVKAGRPAPIGEPPLVFTVRETVRAGSLPEGKLGPGEAVRIMTGAPLPPGADAVVMKELAEGAPDSRVRLLQSPRPGENVRRQGEDVRAGEMILRKGARLRPYEVGLLAAQGLTHVPVFRRPRVSIVSTGDELVEISQPLSPGKIRASNGPALASAVGRWGAIPRWGGVVNDDPVELREVLSRLLSDSDVLLVSGGVSVGDFDYTKAVLEELGMKVVFWKVAIKPGKPLLFGRCRDVSVFGLPGNPVAALVCAEEFVRPALEKMQGSSPRHPAYHLLGTLENDYRKEAGRQQYLFCRATESPKGFRLEVFRPQGSAMMGMACKANALAIAPRDLRVLKKGMTAAFRWLK